MPPRAQSSTEKKNRFERSARTRRSFRSRRVELGRAEAEAGENGFVGEMRLVQCRADSVKHVASPSRRDTSQRVFMSPVISTSVRSSRASKCPAPLRRVPQSVSQPACRLRLPRRCFGPVRLSLIRSACRAWGNLNTRQPFSYPYELRTQHRLESVATRTPPPICASAQSSQTALAWKNR